ncbi:MAG: hypothetical protein H0X13_15220, partial [Ramlibacter sp.]|nr:hypothetical protein [Ramlibacter sp.]
IGQRVFKSQPQAEQTLPHEEELGKGFINWLRKGFGWMFTGQSHNKASLGMSFVYDEEANLIGEYDNGSAAGKGRTEYIWLPTESGQSIPIGMYRNGKFYAIHADHLGTPRLITDSDSKPVWQWPYSAFGNNKPTGVLTATAAANQATRLKATKPPVEGNLRFPGQYFDDESNLSYNYFRSYNGNQGRYTQPDPIGLGGGLSRFTYVENQPTGLVDPLGLDVNICFYSDAAMGFGHVGFGLSGEPGTQGFYPTGNPFDSPGAVKPDSQKEQQCKVIESPPDKDQCMSQCRARRASTPGQYNLTGRQCTSFVRDCLAECGLSSGGYSGPRPSSFFKELKGKK